MHSFFYSETRTAHTPTISYSIRKSKRARRIRITIYHNRKIIVTLPARMSERRAEKFVSQKWPWIIKTLSTLPDVVHSVSSKNVRAEYLQYKEMARQRVCERIEYFNTHYQFQFNRIAIRSQRTRWGSCSRKGNLNFNYKIALLPNSIADYIIVHELCHLKQMNHSQAFWQLVAETLPQYIHLREELRKIHL